MDSAGLVVAAMADAGHRSGQRHWRHAHGAVQRRWRGSVRSACVVGAACVAAAAAAVGSAVIDNTFSLLPLQTRAADSSMRAQSSLIQRRAFQVDDEEGFNVFDQPVDELALDVRELLITDGNLFFIGPDTESYKAMVQEVADMLNYTMYPFNYRDFRDIGQDIGYLERCYLVPPLVSTMRWSWKFMMHGLVVWLDEDGNKKLSVFERDRTRKVKMPKKKAAFGPEKPFDIYKKTPEPPGDPIDMWQEADVHVDLQKSSENKVSQTKLTLGSIINSILESPPKWRGWMRQAKNRGTVAEDFETPLQVRRSYHSYGMSTRLNRLLNA